MFHVLMNAEGFLIRGVWRQKSHTTQNESRQLLLLVVLLINKMHINQTCHSWLEWTHTRVLLNQIDWKTEIVNKSFYYSLLIFEILSLSIYPYHRGPFSGRSCKTHWKKSGARMPKWRPHSFPTTGFNKSLWLFNLAPRFGCKVRV